MTDGFTLSSLFGSSSGSSMLIFAILVVIYFGITFGLAWYGYKKTKDASDFMIAGRKTHPLVMAISYGATFISTSAIIGFGGVAATYGMSLLWLAFLNILVGIIIAFLVFGPKMRKMGKQLHASTFPEFIGKRFKSRGLQSWVGLFIAVLMPLYAASVLIGSGRFLETTLGIPYDTALIIFTIIVAVYVIVGGLISVLYTDAFQGAIMFIGMAFLLIFTYVKLGGIVEAHTALTNLAPMVPDSFQAIGHQGWTMMPAFGSELWWTIVSSLILGVGIGIIAQPQLAVRFMTVKDNKTLRRAVFAGGPFIFMMAGVAYIVGSLSNVYFFNESGQIALDIAGGNIDSIIPAYINSAMPEIFVMIFMLSLLSAAMSTAASQIHTMGTSVGYDLIRNGIFKGRSPHTITFTRIGMVITVIISVILAFELPGSIIARATAVFMGICTSALLPMYAGGLFWKKMTKKGAYASFFTGLSVSIFWYVFVHASEAVPFKICQMLFGQPTLLTGMWVFVDPIVIATPLSIIAAIVVSLMTQPPEEKFVENLFSDNEDEEITAAEAA
ncbi:Osmoregulated proline transporter OpuE [Methanimicrococcus sp. At1]|uniref:Osmoregulated proline transporter OpuE n=1 Tax=Methanimicrococcus hacksteinii TaxID=3028293 RepID=A0ABU3VQB6_9EURY|nr:sodium:solute symporter family protein [Methanimicrococcus sp. At1]MDV0445598.1 Osmoregulated proline transporter OpuE [Methanimicrococcus sp. At1]